MRAERRLRNADPLSGTPELLLIDNGDEAAQTRQAQAHRHICSPCHHYSDYPNN
jgi:hypothetical protein